MGVVIIGSIIATYYIAQRYTEPEIVIGIVTALTVFLLVIAQVVVAAFEKVVLSRRREREQSREVLELKDQFVYIAVHDLSSAATAIKWGLRTIEPRTEQFSDDEKEVFQNIRMRNERLIELVRQILLITKIESGRVEVDQSVFSITQLLEDTLADLDRAVKRKDAELSTEIEKRLEICSDKEHVESILRTLIGNAIFHAAKKNGEISVKLRALDEHIVLSVTNNGTRPSENEKKHMFEKLWRDEAGKEIEGTGFGLYTVHELVRLLKGVIIYQEDEVHIGFTITLPKVCP
jgi:signal transduction histidine kinase